MRRLNAGAVKAQRMLTRSYGVPDASCTKLGSWVSAVVQRVWARGGKLPPEPGRVAFDAWLDSFGSSWSAEEREELYVTSNELCGWEPPPIALDGVLPPLSPGEAATTFRAWLDARATATGFVGGYTAKLLRDLYGQHAAEIGRQQTPELILRRELARLPGVSRRNAVTAVRPHGSGSHKERRLRTVEWVFEPLPRPATPAADVAVTSPRRGRKLPRPDDQRQKLAA